VQQLAALNQLSSNAADGVQRTNAISTQIDEDGWQSIDQQPHSCSRRFSLGLGPQMN
jgi:hypothetical protein